MPYKIKDAAWQIEAEVNVLRDAVDLHNLTLEQRRRKVHASASRLWRIHELLEELDTSPKSYEYSGIQGPASQ